MCMCVCECVRVYCVVCAGMHDFSPASARSGGCFERRPPADIGLLASWSTACDPGAFPRRSPCGRGRYFEPCWSISWSARSPPSSSPSRAAARQRTAGARVTLTCRPCQKLLRRVPFCYLQRAQRWWTACPGGLGAIWMQRVPQRSVHDPDARQKALRQSS